MKYKHIIPLLIYSCVYLTWFCFLEKNVTKHFKVIHMAIDDYIPFVEVFIVPYLLWFVYVIGVVFYLFFKDKHEYYKVCLFLFTGMTIFLLISTLWPNGHYLRPRIMPRDNIFTTLVAQIYSTDTSTNLWPSIHVYNSLGAHFALMKSHHLENKKGIKFCSLLLCVSIILSTVLIKQHSMFDVLTAFGLAAVMYALVYGTDIILAIRHRLNPGDKTAPQTE